MAQFIAPSGNSKVECGGVEQVRVKVECEGVHGTGVECEVVKQVRVEVECEGVER